MILVVDLFVILLNILSVRLPLANWIAIILSCVCLIPMPSVSNLFLVELTVATVFLSFAVTVLNVSRRL